MATEGCCKLASLLSKNPDLYKNTAMKHSWRCRDDKCPAKQALTNILQEEAAGDAIAEALLLEQLRLEAEAHKQQQGGLTANPSPSLPNLNWVKTIIIPSSQEEELQR